MKRAASGTFHQHERTRRLLEWNDSRRCRDLCGDSRQFGSPYPLASKEREKYPAAFVLVSWLGSHPFEMSVHAGREGSHFVGELRQRGGVAFGELADAAGEG